MLRNKMMEMSVFWLQYLLPNYNHILLRSPPRHVLGHIKKTLIIIPSKKVQSHYKISSPSPVSANIQTVHLKANCISKQWSTYCLTVCIIISPDPN